MEMFSPEYIINFLSARTGISIILLDNNEGSIKEYGDEGVAGSLLEYLKVSSPAKDESRVQLDGKTFDIWSERDGGRELFILKKVDDKVELEKRVLDYSFIRDSDMVFKEILHEIRTPLGTIRNFLHIVTEEMMKHGGGRRKRDVALDNLEAMGEELARVDAMLEMFRGDWYGDYSERSTSDLVYESRIMEKIYGKVVEAKGVTFSVEGPEKGVWVSAPPRAVRQVLSNLIRNAFEAVDTGGEISVRTANAGNKGLLEVEDNGGGISEEQHPGLFLEPLPSNKGEGRGFGLWITGKVVSKHGGSIEHVKIGGGTIIRVLFQKIGGVY